MRCRPTFLIPVFLKLSLLLSLASADKDFQEITTSVPQDVTEVSLPPKCPVKGKHPKTMFTIEPSESDSVTIATYPADLVTAERKGSSKLQLVWNEDVANESNEGGVKIYLPADQLRKVSTAADVQAQILDGFTDVDTLSVSSDSVLFATFTSLSDSAKLTISVSSDGSAKVISNGPFSDVKVSSDAKLSLATTSADEVSVSSDGVLEMKGDVGTVDVSSDGRATIDGDVSNGGSISSDGRVTIYGAVSGHFRVSSDGTLYVGDTLSGSVEASSDAKVYAPSCDTVTTKSDAKCHVDDSISGEVNVSVQVQDFTLTGTERCGWSGGGPIGWGIAVFVALVGTGCFFIWKCCVQRRRSDVAASSGYPAGSPLEEERAHHDLHLEGAKDNVAVAYKVDDPENQAPVEAEAIAYEVDPKKVDGDNKV